MSESLGGLTQFVLPQPYRFGLPIIRRMRAAMEGKSLAAGMASLFEAIQVDLRVIGDTECLRQHARGVLFVGDHRQAVELVPFLAVLGQYGRESVRLVAKPFSMQARILASLKVDLAAMIPVIPGTLARDRKRKLNRDLYWRLRARGRLPSAEEIRIINALSLQACVSTVLDEGSVVLCPAGGVMDAVKRPWQQGVGKIIKLLPPDAFNRTLIVPFRFDTFSRLQLLRALHGMRIKPQQLTMRIGYQGTVGELLGDVATVATMTARDVTDILHQQFVGAFG